MGLRGGRGRRYRLTAGAAETGAFFDLDRAVWAMGHRQIPFKEA
jgi:hypothetical protein